MRKCQIIFLILIISLTVFAKDDKFFIKEEKNTVTIGLNVKDFQTVQLFRKEKGKSPVNIFEFSEPDLSFSETAESGKCYFIKVYRNSEKPFVSDIKCVSETFFMGRIELTLLVFFLLLIFSFFAPRFIFFRFLSPESVNPGNTIAETIKILAGEDSKSVLLHSSSDWMGDPVNIAVNSFFKRSLTEEQKNVVTTSFNNLTFIKAEKEAILKKVPLINGQRPFLTSLQRNAVPRSAVFHIVENNPESDLDSFKDRSERRKMIFSSSLSGAVTDLLLKRRAFISIESLISDFQSDKKSDHSGAYLFLAVIACAILLGSVLKTLGIEHLISNLILFFTGSQ